MYCVSERIAKLKELLPEKAFLRFDRGEALFISDAPRFPGSYPQKISGYEVVVRSGLMRLTPTYEDVPESVRGLMTEFIKANGTQRERIIRQNLAVSLRLHDAPGTAFLNELLKEVTEDEA